MYIAWPEMTLSIVGGFETSETIRRVHAFLARDGAVNNLPIRLLSPALDDPPSLGSAYLGAVERDGQVVAAAVCTFLKLALASSTDLEAVRMLARDAKARLPGLPGVLGPVAEVEAFLDGWGPESPPRPGMQQRIYCLTAVAHLRPSAGHPRPADMEDRPTVLRWFYDFTAEALHGLGHPDIEATVDARIRDDQVLLWHVGGRPVSMAVGRQAPTQGAVIGPVFTPVDDRGKGYGTSVVAELSRRLLSAGANSCLLYTDLSNRTSNAIYQRIGYAPVCDVSEVWLREIPPQGWTPG
ncbi:MAG: GNAT family N-acetyltransferase [Candidatus Dormibacteria bacterium]